MDENDKIHVPPAPGNRNRDEREREANFFESFYEGYSKVLSIYPREGNNVTRNSEDQIISAQPIKSRPARHQLSSSLKLKF